MGDEFDPIDWLRQRDAIRSASADSMNADATRDAILERVRRESPDRRRRSPLLIPAAAAAAALMVSGSVAVAYFATRSRSPSPASVLCFADVDVNSSRAMVERGDDPLVSCAAAWADPQYVEVFDGTAAPHLALCRLDSGLEAAFPANDGDPCYQLGLAKSDEAPATDDKAVRHLTELLADSMDQDCVLVEETADLANDAIEQAGLQGWVVDVPDAPDDTCGSIYIDTEFAVVRIVPLPPSSTSTD